MAWIITKVFHPDDVRSVGVCGPSGSNVPALTIMQGKKFRLLCDEDVIAEGFCTDVLFAPLDDYGLPNWGCNNIQYQYEGNWCDL
jgi:hypothetical protein